MYGVFILAVLALAAPIQEKKKTYTIQLTVKGPNCEGCKQDIERGLGRLRGFASATATVNVAKGTGSATLKLYETATLSRNAIRKALRQFTLTGVVATIKGKVTGASGGDLSFTARGSGQSLVITRSGDKKYKKVLDELKKAGDGNYQITAAVDPAHGGGQVLRLRSFDRLK